MPAFLIDTSVWIDYLRQRETREVMWLRKILDLDYPFGITAQIYQEVLQGADSPDSFERLASYMGSQLFFPEADPIEHAKEAARLYFRCRRRGFTIRSTLDCSIAQTAIEHQVLLLHADRDFEYIQEVAKDLQIYRGSLMTAGAPSLIQEPPSTYDGEPWE